MSRSDEQRFRELYDRTYDRVWAFVLRRTPDEEAAADVVSETFLVVWRRIRDVPTDPRRPTRGCSAPRAACWPTGGGAPSGGDGSSSVFDNDLLIYLSIFP